jgi:putative nucleotidyltransferase with HDIG domain
MTHYVENIRIPYRKGGSTATIKSTERWTGLSNLSHFLVGSDTIDELITRASNFITELLGIDHCLILLLEEDGHFYFQANRHAQIIKTKHSFEIGLSPVAEKVLLDLLSNEQLPSPKPFEEAVSPAERNEFTCLDESAGYWELPLKVEKDLIGILLLGKKVKAGETIFFSDSFYILELIADQLANALHRTKLNERLINLSIETVLALSKTLETRDSYSGSHSKRLAKFTERLALAYGFSVRETRELCWAALLHDIGKIGVEDQILNKPGPLDPREWEIMRTHPQVGEKIVRGLSGLEKVAPLINAHHERFDGAGYPNGLKKEEIPLGARIIAVVDSYTAMTEGRNYRQARSHDEAVLELKKYSGKMYDPEVVRTFLRCFDLSEE